VNRFAAILVVAPFSRGWEKGSERKEASMSGRHLIFGFTAAVASAASANAFGQSDLKSQLVGAYSLASVYDQLADGKKNDTWGAGVEGSAIFTPSGMFSVQIMAANRHSGSGQGPRDPIGQMVTYYGTYTIDDASKTIAYHIQNSSFPAWNGIERKATIESLTGSDLDTTTTVKGDPKLGEFTAHLNWKRVGQ
jgi:Lipocalin-like domain